MRTLAFDGRMGASGDMILGALLAAGADRDALAPVETALDVEYVVGVDMRQGIAATSVSVGIPGDHESSGDDDHQHSHEAAAHDHSHEGDHSHHDHSHDHGHGEEAYTPAEGHGPHRTYSEVVDIVEAMDLPSGIAADALAVFEILGEAEAAVHGTDLADTHFHEVGADDAIADVVGACLLVADLEPERIVTTPLESGGGTVEMSHGTYPVPTPAVVEIAERADWALRGGPVDVELLTPTGAAILAHLAVGVETLPGLELEGSGYGAGSRDVPDRPNVLRALVGDGGPGLSRDEITVLETNLDDVAPEILGGLQETLAPVGARDVTIVPTTMKKSRPGHLVKVICKPADAEAVARTLAEETGTLGVREHGAGHRWIADRAIEPVSLDVEGTVYEVDVKVATVDGAVYDRSAEFDDALAVARETGLAVREVQRRAEERSRNADD